MKRCLQVFSGAVALQVGLTELVDSPTQQQRRCAERLRAAKPPRLLPLPPPTSPPNSPPDADQSCCPAAQVLLAAVIPIITATRLDANGECLLNLTGTTCL